MKKRHGSISAIGLLITVLAFCTFISMECTQRTNVPTALDTVSGNDGSLWERVSDSGFGSEENEAVLAMAEYQGRLYALVRNDYSGAEVWRTSGTGWEQVPYPDGETNGIYGNHMLNTHMGAMITFKDKLYVGFSSGIQGSFLKSSGCEVWIYDGTAWEPSISDKKDKEESGTISALSGCEADDDELTAVVTDDTKTWDVDQ